MMTPTRPLLPLAVALALTAPLGAAFAPGDTAFTKRVETALLAEPKTLATTVTRVGYARPLKVEEVRGAWVRVSGDKKSGWVFAGNLAATKPSESTGADGLPLLASKTSATAAARPLAPAAKDYATRQGKDAAATDLEWLKQQSAALTESDVDTYLREHRKGEFQP